MVHCNLESVYQKLPVLCCSIHYSTNTWEFFWRNTAVCLTVLHWITQIPLQYCKGGLNNSQFGKWVENDMEPPPQKKLSSVLSQLTDKTTDIKNEAFQSLIQSLSICMKSLMCLGFEVRRWCVPPDGEGQHQRTQGHSHFNFHSS